MKGKRLFLIIFLVYVLSFFAHALYLKKTVYGDGIFYYSWVRSIVVDHNIDFRNEFEHFGVNQIQTSTGLLGNKHSIGPTLLWLVPFWQIHQIVHGTGYELPYQLAVGLASVLYALFGLILLYRLLCQFFTSNASLLAVVAIAFATNLLFYGSLDTVNSHAVSFFAMVLYLSFLLAKKNNWFAIGASLGLVGIIRPQDLVYGILLLPMISFDTLIPGIMRGFLGFFVTFLPQLLAWQFLYGNFWNIPYFAGEGFDLLQPHILEVLFSTKYGLFVYCPVILLSFIGLFFWKHRLFWPCFLAILLELLLIASWSTWWQGASYGIRMFVGSLPVATIGIAAFFQRLLQKKILTFAALLIFITTLSFLNGLLIVSFLLST